MVYNVVGEVTIDIVTSVEANNEDEAMEAAREKMEREYLTLPPTGVEATVISLTPEE